MNKLLTSLLLITLFFTLTTQTIFADQTATLLPFSDGFYSQWDPKTGTSHFAMVDETSCNGTTDFNKTTIIGERDSYGISLSSIPNGATITQIAITPCASKALSGGVNSTMNIFYRFNGSNSADAGNYSLTGTTPVLLSATSFGSLATVKGASSTLEIGALLSGGAKGVRLSQISTMLTYTPLFAPSSLTTATGSSLLNINLGWTDNATTEDGFRIERNGIEIASTAANVITYNDATGLIEGNQYTYRVRASNSGGFSNYSNTSTIRLPLLTPTNLTAATGSSQLDVDLAWTDNSTKESFYNIERNDGLGWVKIASASANATSYNDNNGLVSGQQYNYRVKAISGSNFSAYSNTATVLLP